MTKSAENISRAVFITTKYLTAQKSVTKSIFTEEIPNEKLHFLCNVFFTGNIFHNLINHTLGINHILVKMPIPTKGSIEKYIQNYKKLYLLHIS